MYNPKILSIYNNLEKQSFVISQEIDAFMGNILNWADELGGIVEKEFTAGKQSTLFLLPKTPCEKKTNNSRKNRNLLVSKCSVVGSTFIQNEAFNLDDTISSRTRGAKRAVTSKMSQLNITKHIPSEESRIETTVLSEKNTIDVSEATFVLPKGGTRTKPVLKSKQQEIKITEPKTSDLPNSSQILNKSTSIIEKESSLKKISKASGSMPSEGSVPQKGSRIASDSLVERLSLKDAPIVVNETLVEHLSRSKSSRTLSGTPAKHSSQGNLFRSQSGSPVVRCSKVVVPRNPSNSPVTRSSSLRNRGSTNDKIEALQCSKINASTSQDCKVKNLETRNFSNNETVTIKKETIPGELSSYVVLGETNCETLNDEEKTPVNGEEKFLKLSKTSIPAVDVEKTPMANEQDQMDMEMDENLISSTRIIDMEDNDTNAALSVNHENVTREVTEDVHIPKKKRKLKKDEEVKENVEEIADTVRITRTKSKALKQMMEENETKQTDLSAFAKKLLNRAKITSLKKNQLAALLECNTPKSINGTAPLGNNLPFGNLTTSKSKYHLLLSGSKKIKTPLATLPNSAMKIAKSSGDEDRAKLKVAGRDSSVENLVRTTAKLPKDDLLIKLKSKKEKEEEATLKRQNVIKTKQEELKRKNELKHQMAMKQREKLEQEKYQNMVQSEKEKEERHKLILQERQIKLKEEALKKKMLIQQKIAETVERRRIEEEARIAKLKEMEAEEQRLALEKQKEQERQEKRAQERLAQKKAREEYEMQLKQELEAERLRAEKILTAKKCLPSASKLQSASKRQKFCVVVDKKEWDYKPRNENDYGLENEHSEVDSEDEKSYNKSKPAVPWGNKVIYGKSSTVKILTLEMLCEFMPCYQKSPDIYKMFRMTPSKRIKRSSSAIWNTPSS